MDAVAWKISELVLEACALVQAVDDGTRDPVVVAELEHLRGRLLALADDTADADAAEAACGVICEIDSAIAHFESPSQRRGAA